MVYSIHALASCDVDLSVFEDDEGHFGFGVIRLQNATVDGSAWPTGPEIITLISYVLDGLKLERAALIEAAVDIRDNCCLHHNVSVSVGVPQQLGDFLERLLKLVLRLSFPDDDIACLVDLCRCFGAFYLDLNCAGEVCCFIFTVVYGMASFSKVLQIQL